MKKVRLSRGAFALVDDRDHAVVSRYSWYLHVTPSGKSYARATMKVAQGWKNISLHRFLMNAPKGARVDHKNGDGLDNRRNNLRPCTNRQNLRNQRCRRHSSRYKGVTWRKNRRRWVAQFSDGLRNIHLGSFKTQRAAARAYDKAALECFQDFANTNFKTNKRSQTAEQTTV